MSVVGRIDVHHHIIPPSFVAAMTRHGLREVVGVPLPAWDVQRSLDVMDDNKITTAITSLSAPGVYFGSIPEARDLARQCNEFAADIRTKRPGRFGSFAVLPMPFTDHACTEAVFALDTLGADGIILLGSTEGVFLGDPQLNELMAELNARSTTVFVHPNLHATSTTLGLDVPGFLIEFLCDTTRAALNLILAGTMERYPRIRWILAHAGGFLPYVAWRISLANLMPPYDARAPQGILEYVRRFYFDTALSPSPYAMAALKELVDPSHVLFGSDFPFAVARLTTLQLQELERSQVWNEEEKNSICRDNALRLFPVFKTPTEDVPLAPHENGVSIRGRLRRAVTKPLVILADHLRNR